MPDDIVPPPGLNPLIPDCKHILFLGAGASAPLDFPVMSDFMERLEHRANSLQSKLLQLLYTNRRLRAPRRDLETVYEALGEYHDYFQLTQRDKLLQHGLPEGLVKRRSTVESLLGLVRQLIFEQYGAAVSEDVVALFSPLLGILEGAQPIIPVFTTNYDGSFERLDNEQRYEIELGFERLTDRTPWAPYRFREVRPSNRPNRIRLILFKLHGSVTWYRVGGEIRYIQSPTAGHEHMVIYPGETKVGMLDEPFHTGYLYLREWLRVARFVTIIGYSFRDRILERLFQEATQVNTELKFIIIRKTLPKGEREKIAKMLGGHDRCLFIARRFERAVEGKEPPYLTKFKGLIQPEDKEGPDADT